MKNISRAILAVAAVSAAGCTNLHGGSLGKTFFAEGFLNENIGGTGYNAELARAYQELAAYNANTDVNWIDTTAYMDRSRQAAAGNPPELFQPAEYGVNGDLEALRAQTLNAISEYAAARPAECAGLAAHYDFLVEQTYQAPGTNLAGACARYNSSLAACTGLGDADLTVFFAFNSSALDSVGEAVIDDIVGYVRNTAEAISVVGHTDTVGSASYNQVLSERRAASVANRMVSLGIDPSRITQAGRGEAELAVPTGNNVREARNRRVEITVE